MPPPHDHKITVKLVTRSWGGVGAGEGMARRSPEPLTEGVVKELRKRARFQMVTAFICCFKEKWGGAKGEATIMLEKPMGLQLSSLVRCHGT